MIFKPFDPSGKRRLPAALLFAVGIAVLVDGCASYHSQPILASQTALDFEWRTLDETDLKKFIESNLRKPVEPWPLKTWSFQELTLVAFYDHPDLDVARAKWGVARAGLITAGQHPNPTAGFAPQLGDYVASGLGGLSPWTLGFTLDIPIETAGKRGYRISEAKELSEVARLNIATVAWQVRSRLRTSLLNLHATESLENILKRQDILHSENVRLLEERLQAGEISSPFVKQAQILRDRTRIVLSDAQKQRAEARVKLASALGLPVVALEGIEISFAAMDEPPPDVRPLARTVRNRALTNRSDILSGLAEYAAAETALQLEVAKQYPDVHIGPGYTWDQGDHKWSLGLSVTLPVLNQNEGPIAEAEARRGEAQARFLAVQARVVEEIDRALAGYGAALEKLKAAGSLYDAQKQQLEFAMTAAGTGEARRVALLNAETEFNSAETARLEALDKAQQAFGQLEDAVERPLDSTDFSPTSLQDEPRTPERKSK